MHASHSPLSATVAPQQYPTQASTLKTVHRTVFFTRLTLSGFESLFLYKKNSTFTVLFFWRRARDVHASHSPLSATVAPQQYPPQASMLKTVHRTVFFTHLTLSGFESLVFHTKKTAPLRYCFLAESKGCACFAFTTLGNRCSATVPASSFDAKNSPPDCFLHASHPLRVRIPCFSYKKTAPLRYCFLAESKGFEPSKPF